MNDIRPNSHKSKAAPTTEKPKLQPVITTGTAKAQTPGTISKLTRNIISPDAKNMKSYIVDNVIVPSIKKICSDVLTTGVHLLFGGEASARRGGTAGRVSYTNYNDVDRFSSGRPTKPAATNYNKGSVALFDEIEVETKVEAEEILTRMSEYLEVYPSISVGDLYDLAGIPSFPHTYHQYGWRTVAEAKPVRTTSGWLLRMPPVEPLR